MEWKRSLPSIDYDNAEFWAGLRRHEFLLFTCKNCGARYWPAAYCRDCVAEAFYGNMEWRPSSGRGLVFAFTIYHRASDPGFADAVPYVVALIELDEGPIFGTNIVHCSPEAVSIGMPVKVAYVDAMPRDAEPFTLAMFEPS